MKNFKIIFASLLSAVAVFAFCACGRDGAGATYTLSFDTRGGSSVQSLTLAAGDSIVLPSSLPQKEMFTFDDWYVKATDGRLVKFIAGSKMPNHDLTLYAGWLGEKSVIVEYDANGGAFVSGNYVVEYGLVGSAFSVTSSVPERNGYIFSGWYTDVECYNLLSLNVYPSENITVYAGWNQSNEYTYIKYYGNDTLLKVDSVKKGSDITEPALFDQKTKDSLVIDGWYTDSGFRNKYTFGGKAAGNVSLYASYYTKGLVIANGIVTGYYGTASEVYIPKVYMEGNVKKTVTGLGEYAFYRSDEISSVTYIKLPDTITVIPNGAFYDCRYLVKAELTGKVTSIGDNAFYKNVRLRSCGNISSVKSIGSGAFLGCSQLTDFTIPAEVTSIGSYAFSGCASLKEITVPIGVSQIGEYMFSDCVSLKAAVFKSAGLSSIEENAFKGCSALTSIVIERTNGVTTIAESAISGCSDVVIYVPQKQLDAYKNDATNASIKDKFAAIR